MTSALDGEVLRLCLESTGACRPEQKRVYEDYANALMDYWDNVSKFVENSQYVSRLQIPGYLSALFYAGERLTLDECAVVIELLLREKNDTRESRNTFEIDSTPLDDNEMKALICLLLRFKRNAYVVLHVIMIIFHGKEHKLDVLTMSLITNMAKERGGKFAQIAFRLLMNSLFTSAMASEKALARLINYEIGSMLASADPSEREVYRNTCWHMAAQLNTRMGRTQESNTVAKSTKLYVDAVCSRMNNDEDIAPGREAYSVRSTDNSGYRKMVALAKFFDMLFDRYMPMEECAQELRQILASEEITIDSISDVLKYAYQAKQVHEDVYESDLPGQFWDLTPEQFGDVIEYVMVFPIPTELGIDGIQKIRSYGADVVLALIGKVRGLAGNRVASTLQTDNMSTLRRAARQILTKVPDDSSLITVLNKCMREARRDQRMHGALDAADATTLLKNCDTFGKFENKVQLENAAATPVHDMHDDEDL